MISLQSESDWRDIQLSFDPGRPQGEEGPPTPIPSWVTSLSDSGREITNLEFDFWAASLKKHQRHEKKHHALPKQSHIWVLKMQNRRGATVKGGGARPPCTPRESPAPAPSARGTQGGKEHETSASDRFRLSIRAVAKSSEKLVYLFLGLEYKSLNEPATIAPKL